MTTDTLVSPTVATTATPADSAEPRLAPWQRAGLAALFAASVALPFLLSDYRLFLVTMTLITAIAVLPGLQGSGVGRLLVAAAEAHFTALGLGRMEVTSGPTHERAWTFYRRLGYRDQGIRFGKPIGEA